MQPQQEPEAATTMDIEAANPTPEDANPTPEAVPHVQVATAMELEPANAAQETAEGTAKREKKKNKKKKRTKDEEAFAKHFGREEVLQPNTPTYMLATFGGRDDSIFSSAGM